MNIWFSSDWHYGHPNIVKGVSKWKDLSKCRKFYTLEEHNQFLIDSINKTVKENDIIYNIGDWSMGGIENIWLFRRAINCKTIHLILGNHDDHIRYNKIVQTDNGYVNLQSLFTSVQEVLDKKIGGQNIVQFHYPLRSWHKAARGSWNLHGHHHGDFTEYELSRYMKDGKLELELAKQYDVGIDNHPQFRPFHLEEIRDMMEKRIPFNHH